MLAKNLSFQEIKKYSSKLAILPVGSFEQHGPYLPLATDALVAEETALAVEKQLSSQVVVFPTLYFGCSKEHKLFPGTVYLEYDTYLKVLKEIFQSIFSSGFSRLLIINGHGGNEQILKVAQADWNYDHQGQKVYCHFAFTDNAKDKGIKLFGGMESHAGSVETSLVYSFSPEYIKTRKKVIKSSHFLRKAGTSLSTHRSDEMSKVGIISKDTTLTLDPLKGAEIFQVIVQDALAYIEDVLGRPL